MHVASIIRTGLALLLILAAGLCKPAGAWAADSMTLDQVRSVAKELGIETKPSDEKNELKVVWISGKAPVEGYLTFDLDPRQRIRAAEPVAFIPADRIRYLSHEALQGFALKWNSRNAGQPEQLDLDKSGLFYLTVTHSAAATPYDAAFFKKQIASFRSALDRALDELGRESKAGEEDGDRA